MLRQTTRLAGALLLALATVFLTPATSEAQRYRGYRGGYYGQ